MKQIIADTLNSNSAGLFKIIDSMGASARREFTEFWFYAGQAATG
jgi:hypothetical protein